MTYIWMVNTEHSHTLYKQHPDYKIPICMAWVSPTFDSEFKYRACIATTRKYEWFESLDEAKDWAQAVVLLTH